MKKCERCGVERERERRRTRRRKAGCRAVGRAGGWPEPWGSGGVSGLSPKRQQHLSNRLFQPCCHFGNRNVKIHDTGLSTLWVCSSRRGAGRARGGLFPAEPARGRVGRVASPLAKAGTFPPSAVLGNGTKSSPGPERGRGVRSWLAPSSLRPAPGDVPLALARTKGAACSWACGLIPT